jgi:hypothetical protein
VVGKQRRSNTGRERRKSAAAALLLLLGLGLCCPTENEGGRESEMQRRRQGSPLQKSMTHGEEEVAWRICRKVGGMDTPGSGEQASRLLAGGAVAVPSFQNFSNYFQIHVET